MTEPTRRDALALAAAGAAAALPGTATAATAPALTLAFTAKVTVAPAVEWGRIDGKRKRLIPITGGIVSGAKLSGIVLPGGGDWQSIHDDGLTEVLARYSIKTDDGTVIGVTNTGVRVAAPDVIKRLAAGEDVDPSLYYFRTSPVFEVTAGPHEWLRRKLFVARGIRRPDHVVIEVFEVG